MSSEQQLPTGMAAMFYTAMALFALGIAWWFDLSPWWHAGQTAWAWHAAGGAGAALGLTVVAASHVLERTATWAKQLNRDFAAMLGELGWRRAFALAVLSSVGEELLFRAAIQQGLAVWWEAPWVAVAVVGVLFGLVHIGPDPRRFMAWTLMAIVMGWALGALYVVTGSVLAPVVAHFTINFLNLATLIGRPEK